jgi:hypothetical protein
MAYLANYLEINSCDNNNFLIEQCMLDTNTGKQLSQAATDG